MMRAKLDSTIEFEELKIKLESFRRDSEQRSASGVDGVLSVDLGMRDRKLVCKGALRAQSKAALKEKTDALSLLMDGKTHTLTTNDGQRFDDLRVDAIEIKKQFHNGAGVNCEFEIKFSQLKMTL
jgi:hypothetical protein